MLLELDEDRTELLVHLIQAFKDANLPRFHIYISNEIAIKEELNFKHIQLSIKDQEVEKDSGYSSDEEEEENKEQKRTQFTVYTEQTATYVQPQFEVYNRVKEELEKIDP